MLKVKINNRAFNNILDGNKKIEGRLYKGIFQNINVGQILTFFNDKKQCIIKIIKINKYNNFYDMLSTEKLKNILPYCKNLDEGVALYKNIYGKNMNKYKVLAILFDLLAN